MFALLKNSLTLFDRQDRKHFLYLVLTLLLNSILTLFSIAMLFPFMYCLLFPEKRTFLHFSLQLTSQHLLILSSMLIMIAFVIKNCMAFFCLKIQAGILYQIAFRLCRQLFQRYIQAPYLWYLQRNTPDMIRNLLNECNVLAQGIFLPIGNLCAESLTSLLIISFLLYLSPLLTLSLFMTLLLLLVGFTRLTRKQLTHHAKGRAQIWSGMAQDVLQGIGGIKETKIYELEPTWIHSFNKKTKSLTHSTTFMTVYTQVPRFFLETGMVCVILPCILFMMLRGTSHHTILIDLSVFSVAATQLLPSMNRLMNALSHFKCALPALQAIIQEIQDPALTPQYAHSSAAPLPFEREIELREVSFTYPNGHLALDRITLTIPKGQAIAFVGASGAGKTSLVDLLLGLLEKQSGEILIDGVPLDSTQLSAWRKQIAYIPQAIYLYNTTIKENIIFGYPPEQTEDAAIWQALEDAQLKSFVLSLPEGLDTEIGENGLRLSGGQKQRIGIARALFRNPSILILDEATNALDHPTEKEVHQALQKAAQSRTTLTIAHRLSTIQHSDLIYVFDQGRVVSAGTYQDLLHRCPIFSALI